MESKRAFLGGLMCVLLSLYMCVMSGGVIWGVWGIFFAGIMMLLAFDLFRFQV